MNPLSLRLITWEDAELLLEWRNHPLCRAQSLQSKTIGWSEHNQWLRAFLKSSQAIGVLAISQQQPVCHLRAQLRSCGRVWLSWMTAPTHFSLGFGKAGLALFLQALPCEVFAEIKTGNSASLRMAEQTGFECIQQTECISLWQRAGPKFNPEGPSLKALSMLPLL